MKIKRNRLSFCFLLFMVFTGSIFLVSPNLPVYADSRIQSVDPKTIPEYSREPYFILEDNIPSFTIEDAEKGSFETYSELDELGRCGTAYANIGMDLMPTEERDSIGSVKPSGWHTVKYDIVDGKYLYNRCHLIGYQLTGENANSENLITGTRYLNVEGMLPFENMVADYIKETGNHVLYRATPVFEGENLIASGVQLEAMSVEDNGEGILFHVYCYNVQPGITIDLLTGESTLEEKNVYAEEVSEISEMVWIPRSGSKYHSNAGCSNMKNPTQISIEQAVDLGYEPCKKCY